MSDFAALRVLVEASDAITDARRAQAAREPRHTESLDAIAQARALLDAAERIIKRDMRR